MMCKSHQNVMSAPPLYYRAVMQPVLPGTPLPEDAIFTASQAFYKFNVVMRNVWRFENLAHYFRSCRRDQFALFEQQIKAQQFTHCRAVRMIAHGITDSLATGSIMFPHPNPSALLSIIEPSVVERV